jgi:hypothetical protein
MHNFSSGADDFARSQNGIDTIIATSSLSRKMLGQWSKGLAQKPLLNETQHHREATNSSQILMKIFWRYIQKHISQLRCGMDMQRTAPVPAGPMI